MTEYSNENRGTLFKNEDKQEDTHADYNGSINVDGKEYWLNAWVKEAGEKAKNPGKKFFSLSVKEKQASHNQGMDNAKKAASPPADPFVDSDLPF